VLCLRRGALRRASKPRGIQAARQLRTHRKSQRWNDKKYNKANCGTMWKCNPFGGSSHAKGIVVEKVCVVGRRDEGGRGGLRGAGVAA
jgi:small subunit ribosomal protein S23e